MAALIVHIGTDNCHRVPVLESAGYKVDGCSCLKDLRRALKRLELKAVLVSESEGAVHQDLIREVRDHCSAPLVLFRETLHRSAEAGDGQLFDLEVPVLQPPEAWLPDLAALIVRCQALLAQSREIRNQAQRLCAESAPAREQSGSQRQPPKEVSRKILHLEGFVRETENGEKR